MKALFSSVKSSSLKTKMVESLFESGPVMNWGTLNKCILMLILAAGVHLTWVIWKGTIILNPELWQWVDLALIKKQIQLNIVFLILFTLMIIPCRLWAEKKWVQQWFPYISVGIFVASICRDGYLIGVLSPATMISYVSLVTVGLVLLPRVLVYCAFIPATIFLAGCGYLSYMGVMTYAPIFHLSGYSYTNGFWILSMLFFIIPILCTCLFLFESLLSQWRHREQLIQHLSQVDPLTNTRNRRSINECLEQLDVLNEKESAVYAVVLVDLDHFKLINDRFGHHKGDEALILVSDELSKHVRDSDIVGRFGGEEFILILHHSSEQQAQRIAERCRQAIEQIVLFSDDEEAIHITASFGIAASAPGIKPMKLLNLADKALYEAKAQGRNQVCSYFHSAFLDTV
ncbi:GGDEF domain-containing protein [Acinetobacter chinensis]|jgi:diguanylate cyclase (GGDEF)-like protein|uniref:diguanylate cyclase n=1 Tax=Acinetobacter chinensis TaxID=2004650 RepID=A0A3B7M203_9GAMM|nr:GGDEF domain-containing protein [Acinetobacter chinensis]AXY58184.1 GGDEF domain-containing protein [Acinetobacter chinensis]